jgi:uncharacterized protein YecE (DUF72 family)
VDRSKELMSWVNVCQRTVRRGVSTYVYVNNHYAGFAPATVEQFQKLATPHYRVLDGQKILNALDQLGYALRFREHSIDSKAGC